MPRATLVWFDPGDTTGMCVLSVVPAWLTGIGSASWEGLRAALRYVWIAQVGIDTRIWADDKATAPLDERVVATDEQSERAEVIADLKGYGELQRETFVVDQCVELLALWSNAAWGYESFQINTLAANVSPIRINAKIEHTELMYGAGRVPYSQVPSYAKTTATDDRMRLAGLYRPGLVHGTDAARHAATFLRDARKDGWLRAEAWPHLFED
jgi:hypothetical protein